MAKEIMEGLIKTDKGVVKIVGYDGTTFTPHISEDFVLSWTNDKGLPNPPEVKLPVGGEAEIYIGENEPDDEKTLVWIDTANGAVKYRDPETGGFVAIATGTGGGTGAPEVHIGAGAPTGNETLWIDTDDNSGAAESEDEYVLIDAVTMTDAAQSLSINREPDGTLYRFKAVMVKMQKPATTAGYTLQCYTYHANGKNLRTVLNFNSASAMGARIENYPRMGYFTGGGYAPSVAYSNSGTAIALPNAAEAVIPSDQPITSLYFLAYGDAVIPAGSTFEIWGVRA